MPTEFQFRRYSAAEIATKTGKEGEIFIDTDNWILKIQDGVTAGGQSASVVANIPFSNVTGAVSTNTNLQTALDAKIDNDFATSLSTTTVGGLSGTTYLIVQDSVDTYKIDYTVLLTPYADAIATNSSLNAVSLKTSSSAEISGLSRKNTPVSADVLLIEDSATSFSKKYIQIGDLPGGGGGIALTDLSVNATEGDPYGNGGLDYDETTGVFTYTPPVISGGSGTVTSVAVSGSDGIQVDSGSPITTSGTIALGIDASTLRSTINVEDGADVTDATNVNSSIAGHTYTAATVATDDKVLIQDTDNSNNVKTVTAQSIADLASGGSGTVTSVAVSGSDGIQVDSGSPITTSGTIALGIDANTLRSTLNVENGATGDQSDAEIETAYNNQVTAMNQATAETGTSTTIQRVTAQRIRQNVDASQAAITAITLTLDGGGSAITTGNTGKYPTVPYSGTIESIEIAADQVGSIVVDIQKGTTIGGLTSICSSTKPTLSTAQRATDSTLTSWTTSISAGDILGFNVDSATTVTSVVLTIKVKKA